MIKVRPAYALVALALALAVYLVLPHGTAQPTEKADAMTIYKSLQPAGKALYIQQSNHFTKPVDPKLVALDNLTISCGGARDTLSYSPGYQPAGSCIAPGGALDAQGSGPNLGGQCCGAMLNLTDYNEELARLQAFLDKRPELAAEEIPRDPYNVSIAVAKKWIAYDSQTQLTAGQQATYDEAMKMSMEGPCCCQCWHWFVNNGIAKKMIIDYKYGPQDIAEFWDNTDICGG